ncbi:MAG: hypothetical protein IPQ07_36000 [Myxococcales bacterium]|nr:hypothetical protein [Myxococcales bacterium]
MTRLAWLLLPTLPALLALPSNAHAYCGTVTGLAPGIASPSGIEVPPDGGIVVGAFGAEGPLPTGDPAIQPRWTIHATAPAKAVAMKIATFAPGLVAYRPSSRAVRAGRVDLVDDAGEVRAWVRMTRQAKPHLPAPTAISATLITTPGAQSLRVELADKPPVGAIAIVLTGENGTPRSWGLVHRDETQQTAFAENRCEVVPNGTILSEVGDPVRVFWVDAMGRTSAASKPFVISAPAQP